MKNNNNDKHVKVTEIDNHIRDRFNELADELESAGLFESWEHVGQCLTDEPVDMDGDSDETIGDLFGDVIDGFHLNVPYGFTCWDLVSIGAEMAHRYGYHETR